MKKTISLIFILLFFFSASAQALSSYAYITPVTKDDTFIGVRFHTLSFLLFDSKVYTNLSGSISVSVIHNGTQERTTNNDWGMSTCNQRLPPSNKLLMHTSVDVVWKPEYYQVEYVNISVDSYDDGRYIRHIDMNITNKTTSMKKSIFGLGFMIGCVRGLIIENEKLYFFPTLRFLSSFSTYHWVGNYIMIPYEYIHRDIIIRHLLNPNAFFVFLLVDDSYG